MAIGLIIRLRCEDCCIELLSGSSNMRSARQEPESDFKDTKADELRIQLLRTALP
jgi:hypothetical protein